MSAGIRSGRELDSGVLEVQDARQRAQQCCLAQARNALQQYVPAREQRDENTIHNILLADDDSRDFLPDPIEPGDK